MSDAFPGLIGRASERSDCADAARWRAYYDYFQLRADEDLPLALHWLLFNAFSRDVRVDGHRLNMDPFPEMPFPRRMWAGGEIKWEGALSPAAEVTRSSTISRADMKSGAGGEFLLTSIEHRIDATNGARIAERQDVVFLLEGSQAGGEKARATVFDADWRDTRRFTPVELFQYSALTLNSHRIHYDAVYAKASEGFRDVVVQGPLLASVLMHAGARRYAGKTPERFTYRSVAPVFVEENCSLLGRAGETTEELAIIGGDGRLCMRASIGFRGRN
jgi:3-methylfumaryl-CoA hydratase